MEINLKIKELLHSRFFYFIFLYTYLEITFHIYIYRSLTKDVGFTIVNAMILGLLSGTICCLFRAQINRFITIFFTLSSCIFFCVQTVYHAVFSKFLAPFSMAKVANQAFDYVDVIRKNMGATLIGLVILLLPLIILPWLIKKNLISFKKHTLSYAKFPVGIAAELYLCMILILNIGSASSYSAFDIYYHNVSTEMTVKTFGVLSMSRLDGYYAIMGKPAKALQAEPTVEVAAESPDTLTNTTPNTLPIDFDAVNAKASNDAVTQLSTYFQSQSGTNRNEYTGLFKDYNVIFVTAEGFSKFVIDKERTPTLYRLKNDGFIFNNYYSPPWYASTSDGEYANVTGLLPTDGIVSLKLTGEKGNNMFFTLGRQLERLDYTLNGYHNNSYTYYGRDLSHPNMGYNWHGTGNWFQPEKNEEGKDFWPQSDLQLIEQSMPDYMDNEPFHTYYMSVSGHMMYDKQSNQMAYRNYDSVSKLPYSETTKGYLAAQLELEKAMTSLVAELERREIADRTLIVLSADHIPYDDKPVCDELAGHELEPNIEWYQNDLVIWSGSMASPITVDKYCYDADILPTVSNLLGLDYDSRLLIGQDILSDSPQLVCFPDRSFISDKCIYNANTGAVTALTDKEVTHEYVDNLSAFIYNKFTVSEMILTEDYYQYLNGTF